MQRKNIFMILGIIGVIIIGIGGYKMYQNYQNKQIQKTIVKICNTDPKSSMVFSDFQVAKVNQHKKTIDLVLNEDLSDYLEKNIDEYVSDHVSVIRRLMDGTEEHADNQGNLLITGEKIEPVCNAIASNKNFVKNYGNGWIINIYNAQEKLVYCYQDAKFLDKPEVHLKNAIAKGQEEHDENAAEITKSVIDAIGNND